MWLEIINFLYSFLKSEVELESSRKEQLVDFFHDIHLLILDVVTNLQKDIYPHGSCVAMSSISNKLIDTLQGKLETQELNKLAKMLDEAAVLEKEWVNRKDQLILNQLLTISGEFKALSILYKV